MILVVCKQIPLPYAFASLQKKAPSQQPPSFSEVNVFYTYHKRKRKLESWNHGSVLSTIHRDIKILCGIILWLGKNKRVRCTTTAVVMFDFKTALQKSQSSGTDPAISFFFSALWVSQNTVFSILGCIYIYIQEIKMLGSAPISVATEKEELLVGHDCHAVLSYGEHGLRRKHIIFLVKDLGAFSVSEATASSC